MSKISTVYDYLITELGTLFSTKNRIPNPYSIEDNQIGLLRDSYGLRSEGHSLVGQEMHTISQAYEFRLIFCREIVRLASDVTQFDTIIKSMEEDMLTARKHFYDIDNNGAPEDIEQLNLGSADPIGFFVSGKNNFLFFETNISIRIREIY